MILMELAAGGMNKAQTHFILHAVPHMRMFIDFIPNLTTATCKNEAEKHVGFIDPMIV
jgi:hypothetical protein